MEGVCLLEVSVSRGSTVHHTQLNIKIQKLFFPKKILTDGQCDGDGGVNSRLVSKREEVFV